MDTWVLSGLSAALAGLAVVAWMRGPDRRRLRGRLADRPAPPPEPPAWTRGARPAGWRGIVTGRLDVSSLPRRLAIAGSAAVATGCALVTVVGSVPPLLAAPLVVAATLLVAIGLGHLEPAATRRRQQRLIMDSPQALDLLAACLAAGLPPRNATAAVVAVFEGPVAEDLRVVARAVELGLSDATAWRSLRGHPQLGDAAVDVARAVESGTRMVETLTYYAREARQRRAATVESAAKAVGVRCVLPMMTCFVPSFILLGVLPAVVSAFLAAVPRVF